MDSSRKKTHDTKGESIMRKTMKKMMAVIMAFAMLLGMSMSVAAAGGNKVIVNTGSNDVTGVTFSAYKVFDATKSGDNYGYSMTTDFTEFFKNLEPPVTDDQAAYEYVNENQTTIAAALKTYIADNSVTTTLTATSSDGKAEFSNLDDGYYIIIPSNNTLTPNLVTVAGGETKTVNLKGAKPTVDKKADGAEWTSAQIGDTVNFTVTSIVPDMTGQTAYYFKLTDTLSKGLTMTEADFISVKIGATELTKDTDYTVTVGTPDASGNTSLTVEFKNFIEKKDLAGQTITYTYKATLNKDAAVVTDPVKNTANVHYGNNPDNLQSATPDSTIIGTYDLTITKRAESETGTLLAGAEFELYKGETATGNPIKVVKDAASADGNNVYHVADATETATAITTVVSPANGVIVIKGLDAGKYTLKETKAPDGYNKGKDTVVEITATSTDNGTNITLTGNTTTIINKAGIVLPSTGSIGTIIFVIAGVAVVAFLMLTSKKRKKAE